MEQKKTLWIIAAVGVFLMVVLGAALILYSPASKGSQTVAVSRQKDSTSNGWISLAPSEANVRQRVKPMQEGNAVNALNSLDATEDEYGLEDFENRDENFVGKNEDQEESLAKGSFPRTKSLKVGELTVYAENATIVNSKGENVATENAVIAQAPTASSKMPVQNQGYDVPSITTTIDLKIDVADSSATAQGSSSVKTASSSPAVARTEVSRAEKTASSENRAQTAKTDVKVASKQSSSKSAPAKASPEKVLPKAAEKTQFWVQVTALSSRKNADIAREVLAKNEINADVFTYTDAKGKLFYRVRVGPYTTKSEAEYWQGKIAKIDNFQSSKSYIASTKTEIN